MEFERCKNELAVRLRGRLEKIDKLGSGTKVVCEPKMAETHDQHQHVSKQGKTPQFHTSAASKCTKAEKRDQTEHCGKQDEPVPVRSADIPKLRLPIGAGFGEPPCASKPHEVEKREAPAHRRKPDKASPRKPISTAMQRMSKRGSTINEKLQPARTEVAVCAGAKAEVCDNLAAVRCTRDVKLPPSAKGTNGGCEELQRRFAKIRQHLDPVTPRGEKRSTPQPSAGRLPPEILGSTVAVPHDESQRCLGGYRTESPCEQRSWSDASGEDMGPSCRSMASTDTDWPSDEAPETPGYMSSEESPWAAMSPSAVSRVFVDEQQESGAGAADCNDLASKAQLLLAHDHVIGGTSCDVPSEMACQSGGSEQQGAAPAPDLEDSWVEPSPAPATIEDEVVEMAIRAGVHGELEERVRTRAYFLWLNGEQDQGKNYFEALRTELQLLAPSTAC